MEIENQSFTIIGASQPPTELNSEDWCSEIEYTQIDPCHMRAYLGHTRSTCCSGFTLGTFFAIPAGLCGGKHRVPVPTDDDVPEGLSPLPLGYHYPQDSTDATCRARAGVWANENGRILIAPWIQSTETIVVRWNGIKRDWVDADLVDDDPGLFRAVELFLRWEHARDWDREANAAGLYELEYRKALAELMYDCQQENLVRNCQTERGGGTGSARGIAPVVKLYYNDQQRATVSCPDNQTGDPVTVTVQAETVASTISKGDANAKAYEQARTTALGQLDCTTIPTVYYNRAVTGFAKCPEAIGDTPAAVGTPVTVHIGAGGPGTGYSSSVSEDAATADAQAAADELAAAQLSCTFYNAPRTATASCEDGSNTQSATVAAGTFSVVSPTDCKTEDCQAQVNGLAADEAHNQAVLLLNGLCPDPVEVCCNDDLGTLEFPYDSCVLPPFHVGCHWTIKVRVPAKVTSMAVTQGDCKKAVNLKARNMAMARAQYYGGIICQGYIHSQFTCQLVPNVYETQLFEMPNPEICP